jgi:anti-sigma-K factor RskA
MTREERLELEMLAAEYVIGLLSTEQRLRFERRLASDRVAGELVASWEQRLSPLALGIEPARPPAGLWPRIERTLASTVTMRRPAPAARRPRFWRRLGFWRGWSLVSTAAAAALAGLILLHPQGPTELRFIAVLHDSQDRPAYVLSARAGLDQLAVRAVEPLDTQGRTPELWLLPGDDRAPISLGLLATDTSVRRPIPPDLVPLFGEGRPIAVSLEPPGGSPTGAPTGPVVYQGLLLPAPPG